MTADELSENQIEEENVAVAETGKEEVLKESLKKVIDVKVEDCGSLRRSLHVTVPGESGKEAGESKGSLSAPGVGMVKQA